MHKLVNLSAYPVSKWVSSSGSLMQSFPLNFLPPSLSFRYFTTLKSHKFIQVKTNAMTERRLDNFGLVQFSLPLGIELTHSRDSSDSRGAFRALIRSFGIIKRPPISQQDNQLVSPSSTLASPRLHHSMEVLNVSDSNKASFSHEFMHLCVSALSSPIRSRLFVPFSLLLVRLATKKKFSILAYSDAKQAPCNVFNLTGFRLAKSLVVGSPRETS